MRNINGTSWREKIPQGTPKIFQKFIYLSPDQNSNKIWQVTATIRQDGLYDVLYEYGRVRSDGSLPGKTKKTQALSQITAKMDEQQFKDGYSVIELASEDVHQNSAMTLTGELARVVNLILDEANIGISKYLATNIDMLSKRQIATALDLVSKIELAVKPSDKADLVVAYYRAIPTQLPSKIDVRDLVSHFNVDEQKERLAQLDAAIQFTATSNQGSVIDMLGADLALLPESHNDFEWVVDAAKANRDPKRNNSDPQNHHIKIQQVWEVVIPAERKRFEDSKIGKSKVMRVTHGTRNQNVAHILRGGLLTSKAATGYFGRGIYGADYMGKSCDYTQSFGFGAPRMMFLVDFAVGKQYIAPRNNSSYSSAPDGYDSVWGKKNETQLSYRSMYQNEYIVYRDEQATITHLIIGTWD